MQRNKNFKRVYAYVALDLLITATVTITEEITCKFTNSSSDLLTPFLGKEVLCSLLLFIHSRYTVASQNSTLYSVTFTVYE